MWMLLAGQGLLYVRFIIKCYRNYNNVIMNIMLYMKSGEKVKV
jgi:hypothetical protein